MSVKRASNDRLKAEAGADRRWSMLEGQKGYAVSLLRLMHTFCAGDEMRVLTGELRFLRIRRNSSVQSVTIMRCRKSVQFERTLID